MYTIACSASLSKACKPQTRLDAISQGLNCIQCPTQLQSCNSGNLRSSMLQLAGHQWQPEAQHQATLCGTKLFSLYRLMQ
jgi:hypothetical protein